MKRIEFIAPVESMRGNLSGKQELKYADNENPAYEAPNGSQSAHNYQPRFIGAKRATSGLKYFAVRTKQTAVLNGKTRLQMALTGTIAAIRSAVMALPAAGSGRKPWDTIIAAFEKYKADNPDEKDAKSLQAYFDARVRRMLINRVASIDFTATVGGYTLRNPFNLADANALTIRLSIWKKFGTLFVFGGTVVGVTIDGVSFIVRSGNWRDVENLPNGNYQSAIASIGVDGDSDPVTYMQQQLYLGSDAVVGANAIVDGGKYSVYQA